eukprot:443954-Pyramimonas_sp.AAC.1
MRGRQSGKIWRIGRIEEMEIELGRAAAKRRDAMTKEGEKEIDNEKERERERERGREREREKEQTNNKRRIVRTR